MGIPELRKEIKDLIDTLDVEMEDIRARRETLLAADKALNSEEHKRPTSRPSGPRPRGSRGKPSKSSGKSGAGWTVKKCKSCNAVETVHGRTLSCPKCGKKALVKVPPPSGK